MGDNIFGTCFAMCPAKEQYMREREGLLHVFEMDERTKNTKKPKADPAKTIKEFSRPAAGREMTNLSELRPRPVLLLTIRYLFTKIATRTDYDWSFIYAFIFDRLRAIRQDMMIQRIDSIGSIEILELIVRFHVYAAQRLCTHPISTFDPKMNNQHLLECLKHLLVSYDECSRKETDDLDIDAGIRNLYLGDNRPQMEAIYILLNLGDVHALSRGLQLLEKYRKSKDVTLAMKISCAWYMKNYVRTCRMINQLSPLLMYTALCNLRNIKRDTLKIMSAGFNSKVFTFPGLKLQELLLYRDIDKVKADCELYGLICTNGNVQFEKARFKNADQLAHPEMSFNPKKVHKLLPDILLGHM